MPKTKSSEDMVRELMGLGSNRDDDNDSEKLTDKDLEECCIDFSKRHKFKVGERVRWKRGFYHTTHPKDNQDAIVMEVLDEPMHIISESRHGTPYHIEDLDLRLGFFGPDGELALFWFDSRFFQPVNRVKN